MLSRRHLRIKTLQTLYSNKSGVDPKKAEKELIESIQGIHNCYLFAFELFIEACLYSELHAETQKAKYVDENRAVFASDKLAKSKLCQQFMLDKEIKSSCRKATKVFAPERDMIRKVFNLFYSSSKYWEFVEKENHKEEDELSILTHLGKNILFKSEEFYEIMEESYPPWLSDDNMIEAALIRTIKSPYKTKLTLQPITRDWNDDKAYTGKLLTRTLEREYELNGLIETKSKRWELERIAKIDVLLIKMALTEVMDFPQIPIKVSINEYIDIAKQYSTPKSKIYINGVLDSIIYDLNSKGIIEKFGRGLKEE